MTMSEIMIAILETEGRCHTIPEKDCRRCPFWIQGSARVTSCRFWVSNMYGRKIEEAKKYLMEHDIETLMEALL